MAITNQLKKTLNFGFEFWLKISPTIDPFQAIGVEKNVNHIFLQIGEGKGAVKNRDFNPVQPQLC